MLHIFCRAGSARDAQSVPTTKKRRTPRRAPCSHDSGKDRHASSDSSHSAVVVVAAPSPQALREQRATAPRGGGAVPRGTVSTDYPRRGRGVRAKPSDGISTAAAPPRFVGETSSRRLYTSKSACALTSRRRLALARARMPSRSATFRRSASRATAWLARIASACALPRRPTSRNVAASSRARMSVRRPSTSSPQHDRRPPRSGARRARRGRRPA
mmetsp:Transcript_34580/g.106289  ORF Transcript_34580/g.106289 Transcript_34580/m.106289 type:complete len:215 (+) Transcript_34580:725-1369(+)